MNFKILDFIWLVFGLGFVKNLMFFVGSADSPSTNTTTNNNDNRTVLGENANFAKDNGTIINNTLDGGAVHDALAYGSTANTHSLIFANEVTKNAFGLGSDALDANGKNVASTLNFASDFGTSALDANGKTITSAFNFANDAMAGALGEVRAAQNNAANANANALSFAQSASAQSATAQRYALDTAAGAFNDSLAYGSKITTQALNTLGQTETLVTSAYEDAKGRGALTDKIMMAAIVGALFVAFKASSR